MRSGSSVTTRDVSPRCRCEASVSRMALIVFCGVNVFLSFVMRVGFPFVVVTGLIRRRNHASHFRHKLNVGGCFRLGRNYTLAVTETVEELVGASGFEPPASWSRT